MQSKTDFNYKIDHASKKCLLQGKLGKTDLLKLPFKNNQEKLSGYRIQYKSMICEWDVVPPIILCVILYPMFVDIEILNSVLDPETGTVQYTKTF